MYLKFYRASDGAIHYNDINIYSDGYFNRLYSGTWSEYGNTTPKITRWADYTLPNEIAPNLNIGAGEFVRIQSIINMVGVITISNEL